MYAPTSEDSLYTSPEFSPVFLTENIAKRQPLHRDLCTLSPHNAAILYCDVIADKAHFRKLLRIRYVKQSFGIAYIWVYGKTFEGKNLMVGIKIECSRKNNQHLVMYQ